MKKRTIVIGSVLIATLLASGLYYYRDDDIVITENKVFKAEIASSTVPSVSSVQTDFIPTIKSSSPKLPKQIERGTKNNPLKEIDMMKEEEQKIDLDWKFIKPEIQEGERGNWTPDIDNGIIGEQENPVDDLFKVGPPKLPQYDYDLELFSKARESKKSGGNSSPVEKDHNSPVPEPSTIMLVGTGLILLSGKLRRKK